MTTRPVVIWVDPAAGLKGMHNLGFVDLLMHQALPQTVEVALAAHRDLAPDRCVSLGARGVEVMGVFSTDVYRFADELPDLAALTPFNVALTAELMELLRQAGRRWPHRALHFVLHSASWPMLRALSVALASGDWPPSWRFHVFLGYWPGAGVDGEVIHHPLMLRYKVALSAFAHRTDVRWYTSTADYRPGFQRLLGDRSTVALHPFFLGQWDTATPAPDGGSSGEVRRVFVYGGDIRPIKGFAQVPEMIEHLVQRFPAVTRLLVQLATPAKSLKGSLKSAGERLAALEAALPVLEVTRGFADSMALMEMVASSDLIVLNYDASAYRHKTSGFLWLAAQLGVRCAVTADTWLEREALRLGMSGWSIEQRPSGADWRPLNASADAAVHAYRHELLQPLNPWLDALAHG